MRWPFGPPHLTLKPSKRNQNKQKTHTQKYQKMNFSVISQLFIFLVGVQKFHFFDKLAQKARTQKTL